MKRFLNFKLITFTVMGITAFVCSFIFEAWIPLLLAVVLDIGVTGFMIEIDKIQLIEEVT